ncbi:hypothetical protein DFH09DRAFT_1136471 [Mycena vulgaris]|nr:hypothetical protein DFH09DRAFT_1136471 [Mycena vulgaris]
MRAKWMTLPFYWTGVAVLVPHTYLIALPWGIVPNPYYEVFKKIHVPSPAPWAGLTLHAAHQASAWPSMADFFIHVNFILPS